MIVKREIKIIANNSSWPDFSQARILFPMAAYIGLFRYLVVVSMIDLVD